MSVSKAADDVLTERWRQIEVEGWTPEHDDQHDRGQLLKAARCYADFASYPAGVRRAMQRNALPGFPWNDDWWKPTTPRRDLVKAAALIIAEIERLDRAAREIAEAAADDIS